MKTEKIISLQLNIAGIDFHSFSLTICSKLHQDIFNGDWHLLHLRFFLPNSLRQPGFYRTNRRQHFIFKKGQTPLVSHYHLTKAY